MPASKVNPQERDLQLFRLLPFFHPQGSTTHPTVLLHDALRYALRASKQLSSVHQLSLVLSFTWICLKPKDKCNILPFKAFKAFNREVTSSDQQHQVYEHLYIVQLQNLMTKLSSRAVVPPQSSQLSTNAR